MKKLTFFKLLLVGFAIFSLFDCKKTEDDTSSTSTDTAATTGDTGTAYSRSNTPADTKVATPATLNSKASASANIIGTATKAPSRNVAGKGESDAEALKMSQMTVKQMKSALKQAERNMMFVDAAIADGSLVLADDETAGCLDPGVVKFTFTKDMLLAMEAEMKEYGLTDAEVATELTDMEGIVGTEMSGPAIHYYKTTVMGAPGKAILIGDFGGEGDAGAEGAEGDPAAGDPGAGGPPAAATVSCANGTVDKPVETILFSDDFSKVIYKGVYDFGTDKMMVKATYDKAARVSTYEEKGAFTYTDENGATVKDKFTTKGKFKECSAETTTKCVDFKAYIDMAAGTFKFKYDVRGRADDTGGFAKAKQVFDDGNFKGSVFMKEYWNAEGTLTGLYFYDGGQLGQAGEKDCFAKPDPCTAADWVSIIALTGTSEFETGAGSADGESEFAYAYSATFTDVAADNGEYALFETGATDLRPELQMGMVIVEAGKVIVNDLFMPPASSGAVYDLHKLEAMDATTGAPTFTATAKGTATVTFQ